MTIIWPSNTKDIIDSIREAIGRDVEFMYVYSTITCSACNLDPVTNTSDNSFCPVCSGLYYITTISGYTAGAVITWKPADILNWQPAGQLMDGDCLIQVELTDAIVDILPKTKTVVVDNRIMEIKSKVPRGVQPLNRILLSLIEKEEE